MPVLKFSIIGQDISAEPFKEEIIANSVNYLEAEFSFEDASSDWAGLEKYAEFNWDRKSYIADLNKSSRLYVPYQVIQTPGFSVSVFGRKKENSHNKTTVLKQITTNLLPVKVSPSGNLSGLFADEETNKVYIAVAEEALDNSEKALKMAMSSAAAVDELVKRLDSLSENITEAVNLADDFQDFVKAANNKFSIIDSTIDTLQKNINSNKTALEVLKQSVLEMQEDIEVIQKNNILISEKFEQIELIHQKYEKNFDDINQSLTSIFEALEKLNKKDEELSKEINSLTLQQNFLQEKNKAYDERITLLEDDLGELQRINQQLISKEDTDFIVHTNLNLITELFEGTLDAETGEVLESEEYEYTNYIYNKGKDFVTNYNNFDVYFYKKNEQILTDETTLEETILTTYDFVTSISVTEKNFSLIDDADSFRLSIPLDNSYSFILEAGTVYNEDYEYYNFDYALETAINKLIDDKVGLIITADY